MDTDVVSTPGGERYPARDVRRARGGGWQDGQKKDDRFMKLIRLIGVPHRVQGAPSRP